jgi:hypothetical protein
VFVLLSALFLAANIFGYRRHGITVFEGIHRGYRDQGLVHGFALAIAFTIFLPIILITNFLGVFPLDALEKVKRRREVKDILQNFLFILAVFVVILFSNWQLKKFM